MPRYRDVYIENGKTLADSGTVTIDIAVVDPISELLVNMWADNGGTSNKNNPIPRNISKIEIVDGSDVIFSMDGRLAHALAYYMDGRQHDLDIAEWETSTQSVNIPLRFGRWLWDPLYALVPQSFRNLQLKISWNLAAVNPVGATGYATGTGRLTVIAKLMEGLEAAPIGFIMSKNHYSFTSSASGEERVDLPTDHPYVMMMLRAWESGINMSSTLTKVKISIDEDKIIPLDLDMGDVRRRVIDQYGLIDVPIQFKGNDSEVHQCFLGFLNTLVPVANAAGVIVGLGTFDAAQYTLYLRNHDGTTPTAVTVFLTVNGQLPWNTVLIPFGVFDDPTTYLMAPAHGSIKAILTQGNAGAEVDVILAQLRNYRAA